MAKKSKLHPRLVVFDFDGVLTDNRVIVSDDGHEEVICSREDGLGFDMLRLAGVPAIILSTERNAVVKARARKLKVAALQGVGDKAAALRRYCTRRRIALRDVAYVGNDLNDYVVMQMVGISVCPADAHPLIRKLSKIVLSRAGGRGAAREFVERYMGLAQFYLRNRRAL